MFTILRDDKRYPGIATGVNIPVQVIVFGTRAQAEWTAKQMSNYFAGCDYIFYVKD